MEVLPEVVFKEDDTEEGLYAVSYGNITALLIEALKEEINNRKKLEEYIKEYEKHITTKFADLIENMEKLLIEYEKRNENKT